MKGLMPPVALDTYRRWSGKQLRFSGFPANWGEAERMSTSYAAPNIVEQVAQATRAVLAGQARYERDGVLLDEVDPPFALIAALWRAGGPDGRVEVVDFGGSLGSTYRLCRPLLEGLAIRWLIVEQPAFVQVGQQEFSTAELRFHPYIRQLPPREGPRVVLLSSVLQYIEEPRPILDALGAVGADFMVIDRTPMSDLAEDRLCVQHVPRHIYPASYPCRILSRPRLKASLNARWRLLNDFSCSEGHRRTDDGLPFEYRGLLLQHPQEGV